ncbi:endo-1,4-beta-xylanase [Uliginosibacterium sp. 31-12]|uniref:endo-1,4-beta-xylanase n=1 Tax=Uliginosibacterium sp. 31-12 TaxID=3062781 RepID=UPI0026E370C6|nr:endo-1,4-beta-xylanase [Uliginosibacterium sp. 31-12]MDO6386050.1 endo-1,4-beta-xylanase [Uliginosibacterium sp. 31-12]
MKSFWLLPFGATELVGCRRFGRVAYRAYDQEVPALNALLRGRALFGASFDMEAVDDPAYGALFRKHCGLLTTDFSMKFGPLRPSMDRVDFSKADRLIDFAAEAAIPVRGHCLIWNEGNPEWLKRLSPAEVRYWLDRHVAEMVGRYAGRMHSWDVVNEPFWPDHGAEGGFRKGVWYDAMGPGYIQRAFSRAAIADPTVKLCLNEAWVERNTPMAQKVRQGLLRTVRNLLDAGARIDAVGLQCHLEPGPSMSLNVLSDFIGELGELPVEVYITELDVRDGSLRMSRRDAEVAVAELYGDFSNTVLAHANVKAMISWQLSDKYSWLRKEGFGQTPLPFDSNMRPNPAYFELARVFCEHSR